MTNHLTRQLDILPTKFLNEKINIIGCGAVGSFTALSLAKMGFQFIEVWDTDTVDVENMNSQFFRFKDIGRPKTEALRDLIEDFTGVKIQINNSFYEKGTLEGIVIVAVDSMKARKAVYDAHAEISLATRLVIDPRMSAESILFYTYKPMDIESCGSYQKSLYSDESAVQERCTAKSTIYTVQSLSALICKTVKDLVTESAPIRHVSWDVRVWDMITFYSDKPVIGHAKDFPF